MVHATMLALFLPLLCSIPYLLEKADDGDGVGGGKDRSEHEARVPVPAVGEDVLGVEGGEGGSDEHTDNCEDQTLPDALLDRVPVEADGVAEEKSGEKREEQQMGINVQPHLDRVAQVTQA